MIYTVRAAVFYLNTSNSFDWYGIQEKPNL